MADNIEITAGSGTTIATDDVSSTHYQVIKLGLGADGALDTLLDSGQQTMANSVPVVLSSDHSDISIDDGGNSITVDGTVTANLSATDNAVLDTIDAVLDTIKVDTEAIETAVEILDNCVSGSEMQVDVVAALPAGTNAIGKLAANSGVDIGDVDVLTIANMHSADYDSGAGTDTTLAVGLAVPASGGAAVIPGDATAGLKVDLGSDNDVTITSGTITTITNDVNIADGGNTITVDGTVTANLSATDNTVLDNIDSNTDYGAVVGGGVEATALRVTIANDSTGVVSVDDGGGALTVDGTVTANLSATDNTVLDNIQAAVEIMDDWDDVHDSAIGSDGLTIMAEAIETDGTAPGTAVAEADATRLKAGRDGVLLVNPTHPYLWSATDNQSSAQTNTALKAAPGANLSLYITDVIVSNGATAGNIKFVEDTGGTPVDKIEVIYLAANGGAVINFKTPIRITANKDFGYTSTTVTTHSVIVSGYIAP